MPTIRYSQIICPTLPQLKNYFSEKGKKNITFFIFLYTYYYNAVKS